MTATLSCSEVDPDGPQLYRPSPSFLERNTHMLIKLAPQTSEKTIQDLKEYLTGLHLTVHVVRNQGLYIATSGDERQVPFEDIRGMHGVEDLVQDPHPYFFVSRKHQPRSSVIHIGTVGIGGGNPVVIAGPCAVENREDTLETAYEMKKAGAQIFRAGVFKPRTTPYNFQGIGRRGLEILAEVREKTGLPVVTEVMDVDDIDIVCEHCDAIQVGTRNMTNSALLKRLGKASKPILLKRSFSAKIEEFIRAAEFITVYGNPNVIFCERGIQTFETYTRYTLDLSAVPAVKELSHLPIVVDPSHGTGRPSLIPPMSRAALAAGADGLMIESHVDPSRMLKPGDDGQALKPAELAQLIAELRNLQPV